MKTSFDLSPVIGLLQVLPPNPSKTPSTAGSCDQESICPVPNGESKRSEDTGSTRQLGDFTALWQFLGTTAIENDVLTSEPATNPITFTTRRRNPTDNENNYAYTPFTPSKPEYPILRPSGSPSKPRRVVTFASAVGFSDEDINTTSAAFTSVTGLETALNNKTCTGVEAFVKHASRPAIKPSSTPEQRKRSIIQKLLTMFPEDRVGMLRLVGTGAVEKGGVHVFIDNSNILIGFYDHIKKLRGFSKNESIRLPAFSFHGLSLILERGRPTAKKVLVGSSPITPVILEARELSYETSILERVEKERNTGSASSGSESTASKRRKVEQAVDEICHLKILESVLDYKPGTIVLASGDGAAGEYSPGFFKVIERCLKRGWTVELVSWKKNLSGFYKDKAFLKKWKGKFRFVPLDGFAEDLLA